MIHLLLLLPLQFPIVGVAQPVVRKACPPASLNCSKASRASGDGFFSG